MDLKFINSTHIQKSKYKHTISLEQEDFQNELGFATITNKVFVGFSCVA